MGLESIKKLTGKKTEQEKARDYTASYLQPIPKKIETIITPVQEWEKICKETGYEWE